MGATVTVRGVELGAGRPEIIVPLTGAQEQAVLDQAEAAAGTVARILEWRTDLYAPRSGTVEHRDAVRNLLPQLRESIGEERCLLVTLRTAAEGGGRALTDHELGDLLEAAVSTGHADMVDVETSRDPEVVQRVVRAAQQHGAVVVGSFHDFGATPGEDELVALLQAQRRMGVDVPKVAVMPQHPQDVLRLLAASTRVAAAQEGPHIAISMGSLGAVSRVAAEAFGSAATFATAGEASAPGQLAVNDVERMLELLRP
ncbi:type I 3-dehydroquinate dehydratase [Brachybacterium epidermidis]|uniref:type I 3-dehydroquinate dehydratase n=1 Tax=Brachybacterium epidermidis TaxID=2781983 RepID=UPI00398F5454